MASRKAVSAPGPHGSGLELHLSLKQELFAQEYIRNGGNATRAYCSTYDTTLTPASNSVQVEASQLLAHHQVSQRIQRLAEDAILAAGVTPGWALANLRREADAQDGVRAKPARVRALELAMRNLGMIKDQAVPTSNVPIQVTFHIGGRPQVVVEGEARALGEGHASE